MQVDVDGVLLTRLGTVENRTHNRANEVQTTCTHDRNGNMTVMPGLRGVYDAWNRLAEVRNASNVLLATYAYNGLNQRVRKTAGNVVTTSFFNSAWQELESTTSNQTTLNIWGLRYIDDLVLREKVAERLYSLADPNWNVVATTNASGAVQERMRYDAFGRITWLNASFATKTNTDFAWNRTFTGQVLDSESGLMLYRNRYYHSGLGRFVNRDPIGYNAGDVSLYRYVFNRLPIARDPFGYAVWVEAPGVYAGLHQRVCVDVPDDCDAASCDEKGKPYCITFSNDRGGGGCSPNSRSSGSSSDSSERSSRAACSCLSQGGTADDATFDSVFGATLPKKFQKSPRGSGIIGPDNGGSDKTRPSTGSDSATKDFLKNLSGEQDCEVFKYFKNLENTRGEYRLLWFPYTCRHFSQDIYAIIDNRY